MAIRVYGADGQSVPLGNVTIPPNFTVPTVGALIEVQYLFAVRSLAEAVYLGERRDQDRSDCPPCRRSSSSQRPRAWPRHHHRPRGGAWRPPP